MTLGDVDELIFNHAVRLSTPGLPTPYLSAEISEVPAADSYFLAQITDSSPVSWFTGVLYFDP